MSKQIILIGGFHEIIELSEMCGYEIVGIIDNQLSGEYYGYPILGKDKDAKKIISTGKNIQLVISPDSPIIRMKLVEYYRHFGCEFAKLISPEARVSKTVTIEQGSIVQSGVNISASTQIGCFVKLNTNCNVMHDNSISDFVTIAPNAVALGRVKICKGAYIGANSTLLPDVCVGEDAIIGAGAVVTKSVADKCTVIGVPARPL
ncbi:MAG: NeuD/PglB/VioB family sugar acetyltransferase [Bacteroidales bacterium]|nr:NeuD/PglB/VioB family sugar acetyltransferase [Bacteroidales bacterium]